MSKISIILLISFILSISCDNSVSEANYLDELTAAGVSADTAQGIVDITKQAVTKSSDASETGKTIFEAIVADTDAYVATRSEADQTAYAAFVKSKQDAVASLATAASK